MQPGLYPTSSIGTASAEAVAVSDLGGSAHQCVPGLGQSAGNDERKWLTQSLTAMKKVHARRDAENAAVAGPESRISAQRVGPAARNPDFRTTPFPAGLHA
jgi:hypothetical protein